MGAESVCKHTVETPDCIHTSNPPPEYTFEAIFSQRFEPGTLRCEGHEDETLRAYSLDHRGPVGRDKGFPTEQLWAIFWSGNDSFPDINL